MGDRRDDLWFSWTLVTEALTRIRLQAAAARGKSRHPGPLNGASDLRLRRIPMLLQSATAIIRTNAPHITLGTMTPVVRRRPSL